MKRIIPFLFIASIVLVSCDNTSKTETPSKEVTTVPKSNTSTSSLVDEYKLLKSDVDQAWAYLEKVEDDKYFTMNRLLEEVSYNPRHKRSRIQEEKTKISIQRFKGLGEMNPEELWNTTLNPETRNLLKVQYSKDLKKDNHLIHTLMGNDVTLRKDFIVENAINVSNLDV